MIVKFKNLVEENLEYAACRQISSQSSDKCFSIIDLASKLSISRVEAREIVEHLYTANLVASDSDQAFVVDENQPDLRRYFPMNHPLTPGKEYEVLSIEAIKGTNYRIICDDKPRGLRGIRVCPALFHYSLFHIIDSSYPTFWECTVDSEGRKYYRPPEWGKGFFCKYVDGVKGFVEQFYMDLQKYYPDTFNKLWPKS